MVTRRQTSGLSRPGDAAHPPPHTISRIVLRYDADQQLFRGNVGHLRGSAPVGRASVSFYSMGSQHDVGPNHDLPFLAPPTFPGLPRLIPPRNLEMGVGLKANVHFLFRAGLFEIREKMDREGVPIDENANAPDRILHAIATVFSLMFRNAFPLASSKAPPLMQVRGKKLVISGLQGGQRIMTNNGSLTALLSSPYAGEQTARTGGEEDARERPRFVATTASDVPPKSEFLIYGSSTDPAAVTPVQKRQEPFTVELSTAHSQLLLDSTSLSAFDWPQEKGWNDEVVLEPADALVAQLFVEVSQTAWEVDEESLLLAVINGPSVGESPQEWTTLSPASPATFDYFRQDGGQRGAPDYSADFCLTLADSIIERLSKMNFLKRFCAKGKLKLQVGGGPSAVYPEARSRRPIIMCWLRDHEHTTHASRCPLIRLQLFFRPHTPTHKFFFMPPAFWEKYSPPSQGWVSASTLDSFRPKPKTKTRPRKQDVVLLADLIPFPYSPSRPAFAPPINLVIESDSNERGNTVDCGLASGGQYYGDDTQRSRLVLAQLSYDSVRSLWRPEPEGQQSVHLEVFYQELKIRAQDRDGSTVPFAHGNTLTVIIR